jgi:hypothetical protein
LGKFFWPHFNTHFLVLCSFNGFFQTFYQKLRLNVFLGCSPMILQLKAERKSKMKYATCWFYYFAKNNLSKSWKNVFFSTENVFFSIRFPLWWTQKLGKNMKKIESSTCIYYLAYFSSSLGGVSIGKTLADYTTKFEASLYQCCVGTQFRELEVPISISKIWSKIGSEFWNWNLVTTKNCNQICNK